MGANAQTTVPTFTSGQVLTAEQQNQSARTGVPVFETTTTRDAGFGGAGEKTLAEGQVCYIEAAPNRLQVYDGAAWQNIELDNWTTYTPTVAALTGTFTSVAATGRWTQIGKTVIVMFKITVTTNGTAGTATLMSLPVTPNTAAFANDYGCGMAREVALTGNMLQALIRNGGADLQLVRYDNAYVGGNGANISGMVTYQAA